mgnify:CR=1 FL=1
MEYLIFDNKIWNIARDDEGWRTYRANGQGNLQVNPYESQAATARTLQYENADHPSERPCHPAVTTTPTNKRGNRSSSSDKKDSPVDKKAKKK